MRVLVVDDDTTTRKMLCYLLEHSLGHQTAEAESPARAELLVASHPFDLLTVDLGMPGLDGFELCKRIRRTSNVPILVVSARGDVESRVRALNLGADDYLPKPFDPAELTARVEALLRRASRAPRTDTTGRMHVGRLTLDLGTHEVEIQERRGARRRESLTPTEFKLLLVLARQPGQVVKHEDLQERLWGTAARDGDAGGSTLSAYVSELRTKLSTASGESRFIVTVRGQGYRLDPW